MLPGTHPYKISRAGYTDVSGNVIITNKDETVLVNMSEVSRDIRITLLPLGGKFNLTGRETNVVDFVPTSNPTTYSKKAGTYTYSIQKMDITLRPVPLLYPQLEQVL